MTTYLLILIYSGMSMNVHKFPDLQSCLAHTNVIGEELKVTTWDNMNGTNSIPKVVIAFCVQGNAG